MITEIFIDNCYYTYDINNKFSASVFCIEVPFIGNCHVWMAKNENEFIAMYNKNKPIDDFGIIDWQRQRSFNLKSMPVLSVNQVMQYIVDKNQCYDKLIYLLIELKILSKRSEVND